MQPNQHNQQSIPAASGNAVLSDEDGSGTRLCGSHDAQQAASGVLPPPAPVEGQSEELVRLVRVDGVEDGFEYYAAPEASSERFAAPADLTPLTLTRPVADNWLTPAGCEKVRTRLLEKVPDLRRARFFTLTIDPQLVGAVVDERTEETVITDDVRLAGYEAGKAKLRDFFRRMRYGFFYRWSPVDQLYVPCHPLEEGSIFWKGTGPDVAYAWKLEFQENGMPHWHPVFLYRYKIAWQAVQAAWQLGGVHVKNIDSKTLNYLFKYVTKAGQGFPEWALDYPRIIRFWQTSRGFYTVTGITRPKTDPKTTRRFETIRTKLARYPTLVRVWPQTGKLVQRGAESFAFHQEFPHIRSFAPGVRFEDVLVAASHTFARSAQA